MKIKYFALSLLILSPYLCGCNSNKNKKNSNDSELISTEIVQDINSEFATHVSGVYLANNSEEVIRNFITKLNNTPSCALPIGFKDINSNKFDNRLNESGEIITALNFGELDQQNQNGLNDFFIFKINELSNLLEENIHIQAFSEQSRENIFTCHHKIENSDIELIIYANNVFYLQHFYLQYILVILDQKNQEVLNCLYIGGVQILENDVPQYALFCIDKFNTDSIKLIVKQFYSIDLIESDDENNVFATTEYMIDSKGNVTSSHN